MASVQEDCLEVVGTPRPSDRGVIVTVSGPTFAKVIGSAARKLAVDAAAPLGIRDGAILADHVRPYPVDSQGEPIDLLKGKAVRYHAEYPIVGKL